MIQMLKDIYFERKTLEKIDIDLVLINYKLIHNLNSRMLIETTMLDMEENTNCDLNEWQKNKASWSKTRYNRPPHDLPRRLTLFNGSQCNFDESKLSASKDTDRNVFFMRITTGLF